MRGEAATHFVPAPRAAPHCHSTVDCGPLVVPATWNATNCMSSSYAASCRLACAMGYAGQPSATCNASGRWDLAGECQPGVRFCEPCPPHCATAPACSHPACMGPDGRRRCHHPEPVAFKRAVIVLAAPWSSGRWFENHQPHLPCQVLGGWSWETHCLPSHAYRPSQWRVGCRTSPAAAPSPAAALCMAVSAT